MSSQPWHELRGQLARRGELAPRPSAWQLALAAAVLVGVVGGALAVRNPGTALIISVAIASTIAMAMLGERAFPWAIVIVAVIPWYPIVGHAAEEPIVKQKVLCAA